jgi:hypothetical protein
MIWQLVKRDPAWKMVPWSGLLISLSALGQVFSPHGTWLARAPILMVLLAFAFGVSEQQVTTTAWLMGLPITAKQIREARTAALLILIWGPALTVALMLALLGSPEAVWLVRIPMMATPMALLMHALAMRRNRARIFVMGAIMGSATAIQALPGDWHGPWAMLTAASLVLSAAALWWNGRTPPDFPRVHTPEGAHPSSNSSMPTSLMPKWYPWWLYGWTTWLWAGLMFFQAAVGPWGNAVMFFWAGSLQSREHTRWLDSLPVGRRFILATRLAPCLLALVVGYLLSGQFGFSLPFAERVSLTTSQSWPPESDPPVCGISNIQPPLEYWVPTQKPAAPVIQAPSGETFQPPVVHIDGLRVYNPYAVGCQNSRQFFEWQYRRATLAVYGRWVPPDQVPDAVPGARIRILNLGAMLCGALLAAFPIFLADWWRFRRLPLRLRTFVLSLLAVGLMAVIYLPWILPGTRFLAYHYPMQWVSWSLPDSLALVAILSAAFPIALYLAIEKLFLGSELVAWTQTPAQTAGNYT